MPDEAQPLPDLPPSVNIMAARLGMFIEARLQAGVQPLAILNEVSTELIAIFVRSHPSQKLEQLTATPFDPHELGIA